MKFRRALIKLTLGYMALIMLVSGFLSYLVYKGGTKPLERRLDLRERIIVEEPGRPFPKGAPLHRLEAGAVEEAKHRMGVSLIYFNIGVLCLGGVLSYLLAKRELKPMQEAFELQGRFTSDAAHELRTPLTAMKTEIEVALRGGELTPEEARELLESNLEEIGKLESLSSSLLKLAQYEEGIKNGTLGTVSIAAVVNEAVSKMAQTAAARGIKVNLDIEDIEVPGDRSSLVELLVILLDNSIKYSADNTTIAVSSFRQGGQAVITVADEGFGIAPDDLPHAFERLYRGKIPSTQRQVEGYGLGLSIAQRIAELHKGSITLESTPGQGTTATLRLPLARDKKRPKQRNMPPTT